jgi:hypothetical protein
VVALDALHGNPLYLYLLERSNWAIPQASCLSVCSASPKAPCSPTGPPGRRRHGRPLGGLTSNAVSECLPRSRPGGLSHRMQEDSEPHQDFRKAPIART